MENNTIIPSDPIPEASHDLGNSDKPSAGNLFGLILSFFQQAKENKRLMNSLRITLRSLIAVLIVLFVFVFVLYFVPGFQELSSGGKTRLTSDPELKNDQNYKKQASALTREIQRLSKRYTSYTSGQSYIVINTTYNRFFLYKNKKLIREGTCSTGSYKRLQTAEGRSWTFKTPRGKFEIQGKRTNPSWHKPDWAFIEEGLPVPPKDSHLRWEPYVLGDYALDLGDSYMIHGTIYKRQLGMPVTHGCVRLNDEDLEAVFRTLNIGSKVFIF
jgi:lipoprotein-anchoring transpeptidase ErfK/SrfK